MTRHQLRACCVFVLLLPLSPVLWADEKIPDTNAGNRLAELVRSVNDADKDELNEFLSNAFADRDEEAVERRRMQTAQVKSQLGKITVEKIVSSSDKEISASCSTSNGPNVVLTIEVTADAPHRITSISIAMGEDGPTDNSPLTTEQRGDAVERLAEELRAKYVFPKVGEEMAASVERSMEQGEYDKLDNASDFAEKLTKQLREICKDRHLRIRAGGPRRPGGQPGRRPADNHGFVKAEFLPGGIGYLKFNYFAPDDAAKKVASAAMNFLGNSKALIFDLRQNGGGSPEMIAYLSSYIFDQRVHLNSFYNRPTETTTETWTQEEVPGKKIGQSIPVYVLTSSYTFSGAEEFSYNLKNMKRGTIVGEVTGGGAHPVMRVSLGKRLSMSMPYARAINPITKTNWEGVGVQPDVKVAASDALDKAVELARKAIAESREKTVRADSDQLDADQMFERATELMSSQEFVKAAELFQKVVEQDPENGMAWFRLGYSLHASGDLAKAIPAHKKASSFERLAAISTYNLACAYSLKKQIDKAFEALEKSIELGMDDVDQLEQDTDLDNLRDDERYAKLLKEMGG